MGAATIIAQTIKDGFDLHYRLFRETSARAKDRFEHADWPAVRDAAVARIDMYDQRVREAVAALAERAPEAGSEATLWPRIKAAYISLLYEHKQPECAETFFNSVAARVLNRRYHENHYVFSRPAISTEHLDGDEPTYLCFYPETTELGGALREILERSGLSLPFEDLARDVGLLTRAIREQFPAGWVRHPNYQVQVLQSLLFRNRAAYLVGRLLNGVTTIPFVIPLLQREPHRVLYVDTILLDPVVIHRLFSLSRSYFMVDMEVPSAYVAFLESIVPGRPKSELYTLLGLQKQGKTLSFRDLRQHLKNSSDRFVLAPGTRGMVMLVFTLPSFPHVFKVIRDWFEAPKDTDRELVADRYRLVKHHDRAGRMADTLEFTDVAFPRARFEDALYRELERLAPSCMEAQGDNLVIKHLYVERRMVPLDVYLQSADAAGARDAIREYGNAVKELAGANIFPGDLLLKNFGVTRYGRVLFYDYDEVCYLTDCRFRRIPTPRDDEDVMAAEPWFTVEANDVFPEQFPTFLFPPGTHRDIFLELHGDLADPRSWIEQQDRIRAGLEGHVFPYPQEQRFANRYGSGAPTVS